jgi:hypothetical protein
MDVLLLRAYASAGMCLPNRCLAMGLYVTLCWIFGSVTGERVRVSVLISVKWITGITSVCCRFFKTLVVKWNIFYWGYRKKSHGWWGWHWKPPTLYRLLYFPPALSAYVSCMARRLVGNTGREMRMWSMHGTYFCALGIDVCLTSLDILQTLWVFSFPFYLWGWIVLVMILPSLARPSQHSFVLDELSRQNNPSTIHSTSHNEDEHFSLE